MDTGSLAIVIDALGFAADAHRNQRRKDADESPYINHPITLLRILAVEGSVEDEDVLCAAALHDYLEDCCGGPDQPTLEEGRAKLRDAFGPDVLAHVEAVSDDKSLPKEERKRLQIEHAAHASPSARLVKLADKIANLRDINATPPADWSLERRQAYFDWARLVIDQVRGTHGVLEALFDSEYARRPGGS
jgi:guanosine-3',5'-bis(diphosphate) 3'-pyrophosphohydrolase